MRTRAAFLAGAGSAAILALGWSVGASAIAAQNNAGGTTGGSTSTPTSSASPTPSNSKTSTSKPSSTSSPSSTKTSSSSSINGTFTGQDVFEQQFGGDVQVAVTIKNGVITGVSTPSCNATHGRDQACSMLDSEVLQAKSANISAIGGATFTSNVYIQSLQSALDKAGYKG